jgi:hypothetical protein
MSQRLDDKPGVASLLSSLLGWTAAFFGIPLTVFFGGRAYYDLSDAASAGAAVGSVQLILVAFALNAYRVNFVGQKAE